MADTKIIIAGGSGLIGSALVEAFRERNTEVLNADIRNGDVYFDITHPGILDIILEEHGPIDGFVNCTYPKSFRAATVGWMDCTEMIAEYFSKCGGGSIVSFGSIYGMVAPNFDIYKDTEIEPPSTEYAFIKAGIIGASKKLAVEYAKYGVRINVVSPGGVWNNQDKNFVKKYNQYCPMGHMASPEDMIELVWLLLNQGSEYITGCNFPADGGWTAW